MNDIAKRLNAIGFEVLVQKAGTRTLFGYNGYLTFSKRIDLPTIIYLYNCKHRELLVFWTPDEITSTEELSSNIKLYSFNNINSVYWRVRIHTTSVCLNNAGHLPNIESAVNYFLNSSFKIWLQNNLINDEEALNQAFYGFINLGSTYATINGSLPHWPDVTYIKDCGILVSELEKRINYLKEKYRSV